MAGEKRMDTNLQKYLAFVKTVELESFTAAAESLGYSQSGISRMIHDLEADWGVSLLERGRKGVRLTSDGTQLLPHVKRVCEEYRNLLQQVDEINGLETGLIRIGTFSSVATHWLPNIITEFQKDYPNIDYELLIGDYTEIERWILEGRVDCGFLRLPTNPALEAIPLMEDPLLVILPESHRLAGCARFPAAELAGDPFMLLEKGGKAEIAEIFERHNIRPKVHFTTWDDYAIMSMVESGLGISILPQLILKRVPYRIAAKELDVPAFRTIGIALRDSKNAPRAVKRFMEYLKYR
ncbi:MAG: LysR family transcriptional regulator [Methanocorpusculum sp.]|nr:LysR family transcriptional regulator [Methanocorpusculum sp.]